MAFITALWCWLLTGLHGIWSLGIVRGYLDGGMMPLYPSLPVTYATFFMHSIFGPAVTFLLGCFACSVLPRVWHLMALMLAWGIGAFLGASSLAFEFQIDFGMTWAPTEAVRALFFHPVVTPFWLILGWAGTASMTRPFRL